ncbi:phenylalanine--tRNA ligase subunit beta [Synechococcus sp. RSCCF101]|uniref:phenylalanine--tRNA ligase subunit beta n=1 Tax=Synechococcus sp. RSCCF101 TaxID=2511069 RepID=UPI00124679A2|nr:phenylalanine--tRNA ligase subunit beta [Synechococcus sp. RSCCF101]QEY31740.1 phenylalanine--tRNA ligase subunit beta [Synechococcus sp. RSCCF101]
MRVSLQWLRQLVAFDLEAEELADRLSVAGFEVEEVEDLAALARGVVVGAVTACERHPDADKLSVCTVAIGAGDPLQIVCGASNVRAGIHVPVATVGSHLPAVGLTIKASTLRGVASSGMICSLAELGQSDSSSGIAILEELVDGPLRPGEPVAPLLGLDDVVLELAITANRPDGLSMLGIAREVAALCGSEAQPPRPAELPAPLSLPVSAQAAAAMEEGGLYSLTELTGITVGPSPAWLQRALLRAGQRPINNVVDVTNYVMLEQGQPLHAFDRERLAMLATGSAAPEAVGLRMARDGERLTALDGQTLELGDQALLVTFGDVPVALAGVIGGSESSVHEGTTSIWLEAAVFAPPRVRLSSRQAGVRTESSSRFEKGLPLEVAELAAGRAVALLQDLCGARVGHRWLHRRAAEPVVPLLLRRQALHRLLGPLLTPEGESPLEDATIEATLMALGCGLEPTEAGWRVQVPPSRRIDLQREVDLIEEVARLVGFDRFSSHLPAPLTPGGLTARQQAERRLRVALVQAGLQETTSASLVSGTGSGRVAIANPLLAEASHLRDDLIPALLAAAGRNLQASQPGFWAFEMGHIFPPAAGDSAALDPRERQVARLAGVICGERRLERWSTHGKPSPPRYHAARAVLGRALLAMGLPIQDRPLTNHPRLHPGRAAELVLEGRPLGWFGALHPRLARSEGLPEATHLFDLDLDRLLTAATRANRWQPRFAPFPTVPVVERDLALVVPSQVGAAELIQVLLKAGRPLLEQAELVDRFEAEQLGEGVCSQAFRLRFRDRSRTLTDGDVAPVIDAVLAAAGKRFKARLRE